MTAMENPTAARAFRWLILVASAASLGCENAGQGAVSGAGVGAVSGLVIGSLTGSAGKGAAIGAVVGGVGGAVIGDQNRRKNEQAAATPPPPPPAPSSTVVTVTQQPYVTGKALGRFVGQWHITGTVNSGSGAPLPVDGTASGSIDKTYFVRLDLHFTDPRNGQSVDGTSVISQTGGRGVEMSKIRSRSTPTVTQFKGDMDPSGSIFDLKQFDPPNSSRRVVIRLSSGTEWTVDVWDGSARTESYTFTSAGS